MKLIRYFVAAFLLIILFAPYAESADEAEAQYQKASDCYHKVKGLSPDNQSRAKWHNCIQLFEEVVVKHPDSKMAPNALFSEGLAYRNLYDATKNEEDAGDAVKKFNELARRYSKDRLADDAFFNVGSLQFEVFKDPASAKKVMSKIIRWYPDGDMIANAEEYLKKIDDKGSSGLLKASGHSRKGVILSKIDRIDEGNSEKVILTLSGPAGYEETLGKHEQPNLSLFTLLLKNAHLSRTLSSGDYSYVGKGIIRDMNYSQIDMADAKINIVLKKGNHCQAESKKASIEVVCSSGTQKPKVDESLKVAAAPKEAPPEPEKKAGVEQVARQVTVVIDPGHGGRDTGAIGKDGTKEKDITLQIAKRLGWQLRNKLGMDVNYTRIDDRFVSLDDRSTIANSYKADFFISIHTNAAERDSLTGYQTFFLNNATDEASRRLAARENESLGKNIDDVEKIVLTLMQNANTDESNLLARTIHKKVLSTMSGYGLKDLKVKSALFYVLVGAKCPAVLVETSFISNPTEEKRLIDSNYQEGLAKSIAGGVQDYLAKAKTMGGNL